MEFQLTARRARNLSDDVVNGRLSQYELLSYISLNIIGDINDACIRGRYNLRINDVPTSVYETLAKSLEESGFVVTRDANFSGAPQARGMYVMDIRWDSDAEDSNTERQVSILSI